MPNNNSELQKMTYGICDWLDRSSEKEPDSLGRTNFHDIQDILIRKEEAEIEAREKAAKEAERIRRNIWKVKYQDKKFIGAYKMKYRDGFSVQIYYLKQHIQGGYYKWRIDAAEAYIKECDKIGKSSAKARRVYKKIVGREYVDK